MGFFLAILQSLLCTCVLVIDDIFWESGTSGGGGGTSQTPGALFSAQEEWQFILHWKTIVTVYLPKKKVEFETRMRVHLFKSIRERAFVSIRGADACTVCWKWGRLKVACQQDKRTLWQAALPCSHITSCCHPPEITLFFFPFSYESHLGLYMHVQIDLPDTLLLVTCLAEDSETSHRTGSRWQSRQDRAC